MKYQVVNLFIITGCTFFIVFAISFFVRLLYFNKLANAKSFAPCMTTQYFQRIFEAATCCV